jgi:poly(3-hydroxybutyrate) depolymerase
MSNLVSLGSATGGAAVRASLWAGLLRRGALAATLGLVPATSAWAASPDSVGQSVYQSDAVQRLPWTRGEVKTQRQWRVLGPFSDGTLSETEVASISTAAVRPGLEQALSGGAVGRWWPLHAWTDVVTLSAGAAPQNQGAAQIMLVQATLDRTDDGGAVFVVGADVPVTVFLNGRPCSPELAPAGTFAPDQHRVFVQLQAGPNHVLLRLNLGAAQGAQFVFQTEPPGHLRAPAVELAPNIVSDGSSELAVQTHPVADREAAPVSLTVLQPGGALVAEVRAERGETVRFPTADWAEGPYEVRVITRNRWNERYVVHLPWFKGDLLEAARRVADQAEANGAADPAKLTLQAVRAMTRERLDQPGPLSERSERWIALHSLLMEHAELELEQNGRPARLRAGGFYRLAYVDEVDGSPQFARAYLPLDYDPAKKWPLVVSLHGYNPANPPYSGWWSVTSRHDARADRHPVIVVEPHGRGNAQYLGIGGQDVLRSLDEAMRQFSVDPDRVYLTGDSMGGSGTWIIGTRHPQRFAAIAPVFGGWDFRVAPPGGAPLLQPRNPWEDFVLERRNSFVAAEQALNLPIFVLHGDADAAVPVETSQYITRQLQRWGYNVRYRELPGLGHEDMGVADGIVRWFFDQRRVAAPRKVRIRSTDLLGASAYWLQVTELQRPQALIEADAEMVEPGQLRLDSQNAQEVRLSVPADLLAASRQLRVVWNGREVWSGALADEKLVLRAGSVTGSGIVKRPGVEGPLSDLIRTPFIVVVGTSSADPVMRQRCREKGAAFRGLWREWQHHSPRVVDDVDLTDGEAKEFSLLLIGGPEANRVAARLATHVPLSVDPTGITLDGQRWPLTDAVAQVIYPHPMNPGRYVSVVAATSADGLHFWNPALWSPSHGFPTVSVDWQIQDGRRAVPGSADPTDVLVASGVFDANWRRRDEWTLQGDEAKRAASPLRRAPSAAGASSAARAACAGVYEIAPGLVGVVSVRADQLELSIMGGPPIPLVAESDYEYAFSGTAHPVVFEADEHNEIVSVLLYDELSIVRARRLR